MATRQGKSSFVQPLASYLMPTGCVGSQVHLPLKDSHESITISINSDEDDAVDWYHYKQRALRGATLSVSLSLVITDSRRDDVELPLGNFAL